MLITNPYAAHEAALYDIATTFRHNVDLTAAQIEAVLSKHRLVDLTADRELRLVQRNNSLKAINRRALDLDEESRCFIDCVRRGSAINEAIYRIKDDKRHAQHILVRTSGALQKSANGIQERLKDAIEVFGENLTPSLLALLKENAETHHAMTRIITNHMNAEAKRLMALEDEIERELNKAECQFEMTFGDQK